MARGRKADPDKRKGYFYEEQEEAVVKYVTANTQKERDQVFQEVIYPALTKMTESIIRRYKLIPPGEEFNDVFNDALSYVVTKLDQFDFHSGFKAYSYCGTIIKNYLIGRINEHSKNLKNNTSYEMKAHEIEENVRYSTLYEDKNTMFTDVIAKTATQIEFMLENADHYELTTDEAKIGHALVEILRNWDTMFATDGSNKFNRSSVELVLKEMTSMTPKQIKESVRKFKKMYLNVKEFLTD